MTSKSLVAKKGYGLIDTGSATYDGHIARLKKWLKASGRSLSTESINTFLLELSKNMSASTVSNYKFAIKKSISLGLKTFEQKAVLEARFRDMKIAKADKKVYREKILSDSSLEDLKKNLTAKQNLIFDCLAKTGLRVSELTGARVQDIQELQKVVTLKVLGKGKKERRVFLEKNLYKKVIAYNPNKFLFETRSGRAYNRRYVYKVLKQAGAKIQIAVSPHDLRHTFATKFVKKNKSIKAVSQYLGHASTATTESMYVHSELTPQDIFAG